MAALLLENKVVLVTGSTTGIGEASARRAAAEGARVMVHGRDEDRARAVSREIGEGAASVVADLTDPDVPAMLVEETIERFGRLDGLVNNAALTTRGTLETTDVRLFDRIMAVNLRAPLLLIQAALPYFRRQGGGVVLNIGSINALGGEPNLLPYSLSKGGLMTLTRNLSSALAEEHIRVNQLNVGWTLTENEQKLKTKEGFPEDWEARLPAAYAPSGRIFRPEEIAAHAAFWLSDAAGPVSGAVYEIEQYPMIGRNPDKAL